MNSSTKFAIEALIFERCAAQALAGFIVNYTPDFAVRFDVGGIPVEVLDRAYRPGEVTLTIGRKTIPAEKLLELGR